MYPLTLIRQSRKKSVRVEMRGDEVVTGYLVKCDVAMNMHLLNATVKTASGSEYFTRECYLRGTSIRMVSIDPRIMELQYLYEK